MINEQIVTVKVSDLAELGELICDIDCRDKPPTLENISACHGLIIKMLGNHAGDHYANEDD